MKKLLKLSMILPVVLLASQNCLAQGVPPEIEKREAAAGFFLPSAMALSVLRLECRQWLAKTIDDVDDVAQTWWKRNREGLDVSTWISSEALKRYRSTMSADQASSAERQMLQAFAQGQLDTIRGMFRRQLPTPELCRQAVQRYKTPLLDIENLGKAPGYERFAEFGETLKRAREDKAYRAPDEKFRNVDAQVSVASQPLASLDAIEAAKERRDANAVVNGFNSLIERGDGKAAQSLGMIYLNGTQAPRNYQLALESFYTAWAMGESDGINALGVMARDGIGIPVDSKLALASFGAAKKMAVDNQAYAFQRASSNFNRLVKQVPHGDLVSIACMTWDAFNNRWRALATTPTKVLPSVKGHPSGNLYEAGYFEEKDMQSQACGN